MEPGREDREYAIAARMSALSTTPASMEPGREDREYLPTSTSHSPALPQPQWNPAVKTGST